MLNRDGNMRDKICVVTGASSGIGFVTARELARQGAKVTLVSRSAERCQAAAEHIRQETGNPEVDFVAADLSSLAEIRRAAEELLERHERLDVLVNNAGGFFMKRAETVDGLEQTFALNHLNYFLLTNLLLERIRASTPARIVCVSSDAHRGRRLDLDDLQNKRKYAGYRAYGQSKLMNVLFTYELSRRLEGSGVSANALHPGFVATDFAKNNGLLFRLAMPLVQLGALSPEEGARTSITLASSAEVEGVSGKYFTRERAVQSDPASYDEQTARRLWDASLELTHL
jgi:NAD(P)-dependent dehydrogenase (short-subunit alcohol dehydrogenase family)